MNGPDEIIEAVSVAVRRGDQLLLVRRGRAPSLGLYAFPGGRIEPGETAEGAARRELAEETSLRAGSLTLLTTILLSPAGEAVASRYRLSVFLCTDADGEPIAADDAAEARFVGLGEMARLAITQSTLAIARRLLSPENAAS